MMHEVFEVQRQGGRIGVAHFSIFLHIYSRPSLRVHVITCLGHRPCVMCIPVAPRLIPSAPLYVNLYCA